MTPPPRNRPDRARRSWLAGLCLVLLSLSARPSLAAKSPAWERYTTGMAFTYEGRWDEAITEFRAGYALEAEPSFLFQIAEAYRQSARPREAIAAYREYLQQAPGLANRAEIEQRIAALRREPGAAAAPSTDGQKTAQDGVPSAPTRIDSTFRPRPSPLDAYLAKAPLPERRPQRKFRTAGIALAITGGAVAAVGGYLVALAYSNVHTMNQPLSTTTYNPAVLEDARKYEAGGAAALSIGAAALVTGAGLPIAARSDQQSSAALPPPRVSVSPTFYPGGAGAGVAMGF